MKNIVRFMTALSALVAVFVLWSASAARAEDGFSAVPDQVRAIKFDPFVSPKDDFYGDDKSITVAEKVARWKELGFNTVYLIAYYRSGSACFPADEMGCVLDEDMFGLDFLDELTRACAAEEMCLFAGAWMFRDDPAWYRHPTWRQKMSGQLDSSEDLICPFSPYLETFFYPLFEKMYAEYGIRNFFLQEMWFTWDGMGRSSSFSPYSIEAFNQRTGGAWTPENVSELENAIANDEDARRQWYQMHFDKEVEIIDRLKSIGGGTIAWHNMREAEWELVMADPAKLEGVFINSMTLYPEIQIWDAKSTDDLDPFLTYKWTSKFVNAIGGFRKVLEYYSLYGYGGVTRPLVETDYVNIYLAARASGIAELVVEQDAFINRMEAECPGAWDAIAMTYSKYDPLFDGAAFVGSPESAKWADGEESTNRNRRFLTAWRTKDTEIVIAGVSSYKKPVDIVLYPEGRTVRDAEGRAIDQTTITLKSGEVRVFLME